MVHICSHSSHRLPWFTDGLHWFAMAYPYPGGQLLWVWNVPSAQVEGVELASCYHQLGLSGSVTSYANPQLTFFHELQLWRWLKWLPPATLFRKFMKIPKNEQSCRKNCMSKDISKRRFINAQSWCPLQLPSLPCSNMLQPACHG